MGARISKAEARRLGLVAPRDPMEALGQAVGLRLRRVEPDEPARFIIRIPNWHPAPVNRLYSGHWAKRKRLKEKDADIVAHYAQPWPKATSKRRVKVAIVLGPRQRACDSDAYFKSLLDALKHAGMIVDDSPKWVELAPVEFTRGDRATEIWLEDI